MEHEPRIRVLLSHVDEIVEMIELLNRMQDEPTQMGDVEYAGGALAMYEWLVGINEPPVTKDYWR